MRKNADRHLSVDAAKAAKLRHLLDINAASGDLGETAERRFMEAIDTAEGRAPKSHRKHAAA